MMGLYVQLSVNQKINPLSIIEQNSGTALDMDGAHMAFMCYKANQAQLKSHSEIYIQHHNETDSTF
jgi:hypothetical protein